MQRKGRYSVWVKRTRNSPVAEQQEQLELISHLTGKNLAESFKLLNGAGQEGVLLDGLSLDEAKSTVARLKEVGLNCLYTSGREPPKFVEEPRNKPGSRQISIELGSGLSQRVARERNKFFQGRRRYYYKPEDKGPRNPIVVAIGILFFVVSGGLLIFVGACLMYIFFNEGEALLTVLMVPIPLFGLLFIYISFQGVAELFGSGADEGSTGSDFDIGDG